MKKPVFLFLCISAILTNCGQQNTPAASMLSPDSLGSPGIKGEMVEFKTPGGPAGQAYEIKSATPSKKYLFLFHEWWGLNAYTKGEAERWHSLLDDVNVLAIDLYDGRVTTKARQAEEYADNLEDERAEAIIQGALQYVPYDARVATIGWGLGGTWSIEAAIIAGANAIGCVLFYGEPVDNDQKLKRLNTDVLAIFGLEDKSIPPAIVEDFEGEMEDANEEASIALYPAGHGFVNPNSDNYDPEAAKKANKEALKYLKKKYRESY